jgi:hypothetical protein
LLNYDPRTVPGAGTVRFTKYLSMVRDVSPPIWYEICPVPFLVNNTPDLPNCLDTPMAQAYDVEGSYIPFTTRTFGVPLILTIFGGFLFLCLQPIQALWTM